ncbi:MAG TPA: hypothetical protein VJ032_12280 [Thermoanaerobaculia bacterium]|nr:hypothetical protein [Thermoanaerobaculia bacterium]
MLLLLVADFFRRRRPRRARDEMPVQPLLDVLALWGFLSMGGLMGSIGATAIVAHAFGAVTLDRLTFAAAALLVMCAAICLWRAVILWFRLNRS